MADHEMAGDEPSTGLGEPQTESADYSMGGDTAEVRRNGRLVDLRRSQDGAYQILMRGRVIQGFCSQFEDITSWQQPRDTQLQARISIVPTGRLRSATYPEEQPDGPERDDRVQRRLMPDGVNAIPSSQDHLPQWQVEALRHLRMERDQMEHTIDMIESLGRR